MCFPFWPPLSFLYPPDENFSGKSLSPFKGCTLFTTLAEGSCTHPSGPLASKLPFEGEIPQGGTPSDLKPLWTLPRRHPNSPPRVLIPISITGWMEPESHLRFKNKILDHFFLHQIKWYRTWIILYQESPRTSQSTIQLNNSNKGTTILIKFPIN